MLGNRIKSLRESYQISQVTLARELHISKQSVSNWENENILPSIEMLTKIAVYFSVTTDYLLGLSNNRQLLDVSGLSESEIAHLQLIIQDIRNRSSAE